MMVLGRYLVFEYLDPQGVVVLHSAPNTLARKDATTHGKYFWFGSTQALQLPSSRTLWSCLGVCSYIELFC